MQLKNTPYYFVAMFLILGFTNCQHYVVKRPDLIIDKTKIESLVSRYDTTYILVWTNWCETSKSACNSEFIPLATRFKKLHNNANVILIAADAEIPESEILAHRSKGINSFYLSNPGTFSWFNRLRIKSFFNYCFPNAQLTCLDGLFFSTPVKMLVTPKALITEPTQVLAEINKSLPPSSK